MANYTDPAALFAVVCIILVVMAAGVLTIYSIHYVSMIPKVQEYGKLRPWEPPGGRSVRSSSGKAFL